MDARTPRKSHPAFGSIWGAPGWLKAPPIPSLPSLIELGITLGKDKSDLFKVENIRFQRNGDPLNDDQRAACLVYYEDSYKAIAKAAKQDQDVAISDVIDLGNEFAAPLLGSIRDMVGGKDIDLVSTADFASATGELGFPVLHGYGNLVSAWGADVEVSLNTRVERD